MVTVFLFWRFIFQKLVKTYLSSWQHWSQSKYVIYVLLADEATRFKVWDRVMPSSIWIFYNINKAFADIFELVFLVFVCNHFKKAISWANTTLYEFALILNLFFLVFLFKTIFCMFFNKIIVASIRIKYKRM